jgi:hypothetical protein
MPDAVIPLVVDNVRVGTVTFDPTKLTATRSGDAVRMGLPITIELKWTEPPAPRPLLSDLRCTIHILRPGNDPLELGMAFDEEHYMPAKGGSQNIRGNLFWRVSYATLALIEKIREGKPPTFRIDLSASICDLLPTKNGWRELRTAPKTVTGMTHIGYSLEAWTAMRRSVNISQHVLLDIPFPTTAPPGWENVWKHVMDAVASFEQGGYVAWKNCVTSVREALTEWAKLEAPNLGPQAPQQRTLPERVDHVRKQLRNLANLGPHGHAENWTRDDALLVLATLCALLARRHP